MQSQPSTSKPIIHRITWTVPSAREADTGYTVSADRWDGPLACTCPAGDFPKTRGRCWHLKAVHAGLAGKPVVRLTIVPRPVGVAA
jgi:hypothetical protein